MAGSGAPRCSAAHKETHTLHDTTSPRTLYRRDAFTSDIQDYPTGAGSGIVWDKQGHVVTNYHVIKGASNVSIVVDGGTEFTAKVLGQDEDRDVAVLQVEEKPVCLPFAKPFSSSGSACANSPEHKTHYTTCQCPQEMYVLQEALRPVSLGSSADVSVGQKVYAIGNPFGLDHTLTTGIISGVHREIQSGITGRPIQDAIQVCYPWFTHMLTLGMTLCLRNSRVVISGRAEESLLVQTDAAINPGNSGGPLLDSGGA